MPAGGEGGPTLAQLLEESAEELYDSAPCGYLSTLPSGQIIKVNRTFVELTGYRPDELVRQRRFVDLLTAGAKLYHESHFSPLLHMQGSVREIALELVTAQGNRLPVLVNASLKCDAARRPLVLRITVFNATDRREYERELLRARQRAEQASQVRAEFIAMLSHEVRTPLTTILNIMSGLEATELTPKQKSYVGFLRAASESLAELVGNVLDFSKLEAGKAPIEERPLDLSTWVPALIETLRAKPLANAVTLTADVDARLPRDLLCDSIKLRQILLNLLSNAIKFTPRGSIVLSVVLLESWTHSVAVAFKVKDTGIGIPTDRLPHIFEAFTQANTEIGEYYGGSGLGLTICRRLVRMLGGDISVVSTPGDGSTFSFDLTLRRASGVEADDLKADLSPLSGLSVLVIEAQNRAAPLCCRLLGSWGVRFDLTPDVQRAVALVRKRHYDLVLVDVTPPPRKANAAIRELRQLVVAVGPELPIVGMSSGNQSPRDLGLSDVITSPITPAKLFEKLIHFGLRTG